MFGVNIALTVLLILLWIGVCYIVMELIKHLIDKRNLERKFLELQSKFQEYQQNNSDQLQDFQKSYQSLYQQYVNYQKEVNEKQTENALDLESISDYTNRMIQLNQEFFEKVKLISTLLSQKEPDQNRIQKLIEELSKDIESQKSFKREQEIHRLERKSEIERQRKNELHRGRELSDDFER